MRRDAVHVRPRRSECTVAAILLASACLEPPARTCAGDDECLLDGREGKCGSPGYCVYESSRCPGGEFGPFAGEGLAGQCFESSGSSTTSGTPSSSGPPTGTATTGGGSSTDDTMPMPMPSATEIARWTAGGSVELGSAAAVAERIAIAGTAGGELMLHVLDASGTEDWVVDPAAVVGGSGEFVALDTSGKVWVAGNRSGGQDGGRPYVARFSTEGEVAWQRTWDTLGPDELVGAGIDASGATAFAGQFDGAPWLVRLNADGDTVLTQQWVFGDEGLSPAAADVTLGGVAVLAGPVTQSAGFGLRIVNESGAVLFNEPMGDVEGRVAAHVVAGPASVTVAGAADPWLAQADYQGEARWSIQTEASALADLAIDAEGRPTVVGGRDGETWVAQFDTEGAAVWSLELDAGGFRDAVVATANSDVIVAAVAPSSEEVIVWRVTP